MKINVSHTLDLNPQQVQSYLAYARERGLDYGEPTDRELIERLVRFKLRALHEGVLHDHPPAPPPPKKAGKKRGPRLAWRQEPLQPFMSRGLGVDLTYGGKELICVRPTRDGRWYFCGGELWMEMGGEPLGLNSHDWGGVYATIEEAKQVARAHAEKHLEDKTT